MARGYKESTAEWQAFETPENKRQMYGGEFMVISSRHFCIKHVDPALQRDPIAS